MVLCSCLHRWPRNYPAATSVKYSCAFSLYYSILRLGVQPLGRDKCPSWPGITCLILGAGHLEGDCPEGTISAFAPFFSLVVKKWSAQQCPVINLVLVGQESRYPQTHTPFRIGIRKNLLCKFAEGNDPEVVDINVCAFWKYILCCNLVHMTAAD